MTWTLVLRPSEIESFAACRRAWDLGARVRRDLVPVLPAPFDFDAAVRAGLAVYYFPAMDDWSRSIVRPLAVEGFRRAMREDRAAYETVAAFDEALAETWDRAWRLGHALLHRYFAFAAAFDDFDSVLADDDLWVPVPDPDKAGTELGTHDGRPIRYLCRLDQLIGDPDDEWWVVDHRLSWGRWTADRDLLDARQTVRTLWALESAYPQIHVAGTVHNELLVSAEVAVDPPRVRAEDPDIAVDAELDRRDMTAGARRTNLRRSPMTPAERILGSAFDRPDEIAHREEAHEVRRTWVRRGHGEIHVVGEQLAREAWTMIDPDVTVPASPASDVCGRCPFLAPCLVMESGGDAEPMLRTRYRQRLPEEFDESGLRTSTQRVRARAHLGGTSLRSGGERRPARDR
ncbi:MAG TPA: hypothetical protein VK461_01770, partial [Acidimicrobiales bacterium]|nr:hypothetical protein [Acidimicrobiales bacterium]